MRGPATTRVRMPRLLTLHIVRHVLGTTAVVALAMLAIHSFISLVTEADETGKGGFGVAQLLLVTLLQLPSGLALLMPIVDRAFATVAAPPSMQSCTRDVYV